ncbi:ion channel [Albidovulum inexpectatum]|uniref:Ion channel n=1 Tax=Albidovulum inexpectatum TaxID=196587 RepID=A0A2S5JMA2_9RHOB|nr:ion channel [Albidovulum inexpectatum]PPB82375.1 ion channel [Albidovulum inexpectatum]
MILQLAVGTGLILLTVFVAGLAFWAVETAMLRAQDWFLREPHGLRLSIGLGVAVVWVLGVITASVWIWAIAFRLLGLFATMEGAVYFALVAFTTLGFGDILLPVDWRLLGGLAAANGLLIMGFLTAMLVEIMRNVRVRQLETRRKRG